MSFEELEKQGLVRINYEPDLDPDHSWVEQDCFNDDYRRHYYKQVADEGVWGCIGYYKCSCCGTWVEASSVWGFVGQDAHDYLQDIKDETVKQCKSVG